MVAQYAIPALLAALSLGSKFFEKKPKATQYPGLAPEQVSLQNQLLSMLQGQLAPGGTYGQGQSYLQNLLSGSPTATSAFEAPHMRQFQEQTLPGIAERFSGLGAGAQSSSAFQQQLGQAGASLQEQLASLRGGLQLGGLGQALGGPSSLLSGALASRFTTGLQPQQPGGLAEFLAPLLGGYGQGIGQQLGQGFGGASQASRGGMPQNAAPPGQDNNWMRSLAPFPNMWQ